MKKIIYKFVVKHKELLDVFLYRTYLSNCTKGILKSEVLPIDIFTLELKWDNNRPNISCIKEGIYEVERTYSPSFKKRLWLVKNVPGRSGIRIHVANFTRELLGCIAPGLKHYDIDDDGIIDVSDSEKALDILNKYLPDKFRLTILHNDK